MNKAGAYNGVHDALINEVLETLSGACCSVRPRRYNGVMYKASDFAEIANSLNYLIHNTKASKNKYQYSVNDVVSYNIEHIDDDMPIDNTYYVVEDMLKGLPRMELLKKYGRDFLYHYFSYVQFVKDLGSEEFQKMAEDMSPVYGEPLPFF